MGAERPRGPAGRSATRLTKAALIATLHSPLSPIPSSTLSCLTCCVGGAAARGMGRRRDHRANRRAKEIRSQTDLARSVESVGGRGTNEIQRYNWNRVDNIMSIAYGCCVIVSTLHLVVLDQDECVGLSTPCLDSGWSKSPPEPMEPADTQRAQVRRGGGVEGEHTECAAAVAFVCARCIYRCGVRV